MVSTLETILEDTFGVERGRKFIQEGMSSEKWYASVQKMINELGADKYKRTYDYLLEKMHFPEHLDAKECMAIGLGHLFKSAPGAIIFYKELANELSQPEEKRDNRKLVSRLRYFENIIVEILDSYYDARAKSPLT